MQKATEPQQQTSLTGSSLDDWMIEGCRSLSDAMKLHPALHTISARLPYCLDTLVVEVVIDHHPKEYNRPMSTIYHVMWLSAH